MIPIGKRVFDILAAFSLLFAFSPVIGIVCIAVKITSRGPVLYKSERVGAHEVNFIMYKFRTMRTETPQLATHLLDQPDQYLTPIGRFLRRSSLDELPQLLNVIRGEMSLVGPRPALFNQTDLVILRQEAGVDALCPGVTGWAQINGRDDIPIPVKVAFDAEYLDRQSALFDLRILLKSVELVVLGRGVNH